ncbi:EexN family lipoprotein [Wenzhouxiangella sp. XN24]|uniref:EexN family lipoprotein n=1 Tax=Wenzhouxiangella sp. XN24 TaxID=2713569 RepID=UPI0013EB27EA|nr:EexN family lipoprotein [Wenzhouxiangella sp. XN24]NGX15719.1 EexN family lipoprotein [Wenzhouxiangella sp. XN24]
MRTALLVLGTALLLGGCTEKKTLSVVDFLENEAVLYGTLTRCNEDPSGMDPRECSNARQAAERIAAIEERTMREAREQAFESARAEYREQLEQERELRIRAEEEAEAARLEALTTSSEGPADVGTADGGAGGTTDAQAPADVAPPEPDDQPAEDPPG